MFKYPMVAILEKIQDGHRKWAGTPALSLLSCRVSSARNITYYTLAVTVSRFFVWGPQPGNHTLDRRAKQQRYSKCAWQAAAAAAAAASVALHCHSNEPCTTDVIVQVTTLSWLYISASPPPSVTDGSAHNTTKYQAQRLYSQRPVCLSLTTWFHN